MVIAYRPGADLLEAAADRVGLVCPVNCVGKMGKGLALDFAKRWSSTELMYQHACASGWLKPGRVFAHMPAKGGPIVFHTPTKRHWRDRSRFADVEAGAIALAFEATRLAVRELHVPKLGCGLGGLSWDDVRPMLARVLGVLDMPVFLYGEPGP